MRKYKGLFVPVPPSKEWTWMLKNGFCRGMNTNNCNTLDCKECIYAAENSHQRQQFYKETFENKKKETKTREYEGLFVPCEPKKEWTWMLTDTYCRCKGTRYCRGIACKECIYSCENCHQRQQFYKETFKDKKKETKMKKATKKGTVMELPNEEVEFKFKNGDIVTVVNPNGTVSIHEICDILLDALDGTRYYVFDNEDEVKEEHISHKLNCEKFSRYAIRGNHTEELKRLILLCSEEV